jgi:hypothetical protein
MLEGGQEGPASLFGATGPCIDPRELYGARSVSGRIGERLEESLLGFVGASFSEESYALAKRRWLCLNREKDDENDQLPSSAKTALAIACPLVPAAQPA